MLLLVLLLGLLFLGATLLVFIGFGITTNYIIASDNIKEDSKAKETSTETKETKETKEDEPRKAVKELVKAKTLMEEEEPYAAVVPNQLLSSTCSKCFVSKTEWKKEKISMKRCIGCKFLYYCSKECQEADWDDHKDECRYLKYAANVPCPLIRVICKMIRKSKNNPDLKAFNGRTFDSLEHHRELQEKGGEAMKFAGKYYADLQEFMKKDTPDYETFLIVYLKMVHNTVSLTTECIRPVIKGIAVYLGLSGHSHSCRPNAFIISRGRKLLLRTTNLDSDYNEKLTVNRLGHVHPFYATEVRRKLLALLDIPCNCEACLDIESDKKMSSGRPLCHPDGWFSIADRRCSICNREESVKHTENVIKINNLVQKFLIRCFSDEEVVLQLDNFIEFFSENARKFLSNENANFIGFVYRILCCADLRKQRNFTDVCLPMMWNRPRYDLCRLHFLFRHYLLLKQAKNIPCAIWTLDEAIKSAKLIYGEDSQLMLELEEEKRYCDSQKQMKQKVILISAPGEKWRNF